MYELQRFELWRFFARRFFRDLKTLFELHKFELDRVDCICYEQSLYPCSGLDGFN